MKTWLIGALVLAMVAAGAPSLSQAKRLGGGGSSGMQRNMPARTAPDAAPAKPAAPAQQANPGAPANAAPAAPAGKRSWLGPIAGLAAGLGLAALMSHMGMGEGFSNFLMLALLGAGAVFLVLFLVRRFGGGQTQSTALAGANTGAGGTPAGQVAWPSQPAQALQRVQPELPLQPLQPLDPPPLASPGSVARAFVPASFDSEAFARTAKLIFIRMQAANDSADLNDLRAFTTPELYATVRLEIQERGSQPQHTDVTKVEAEVLDVTQEAERQVVSVRFRGQVVEEQDGKATDFNEIWHLVKPHDDSRNWAIAGIEQSH